MLPERFRFASETLPKRFRNASEMLPVLLSALGNLNRFDWRVKRPLRLTAIFVSRSSVFQIAKDHRQRPLSERYRTSAFRWRDSSIRCTLDVSTGPQKIFGDFGSAHGVCTCDHLSRASHLRGVLF
jgi:hypothetical protein